MIIFKKMFAEKILRFHEAMNRFSELLMRMPHLGDKIRNQIEENDNYRLKMTFGVIAQIGIVLPTYDSFAYLIGIVDKEVFFLLKLVVYSG